MYVRRDQANQLVREHFDGVLSQIRRHQDFLYELLDGSDWAFVIKAQALIEGVVTQAILAQVGDDRIKKTVEIMPLVGEEVSKLALAKDFGILSSEQRRFVKRMATLRNRLAHRVEMADFTFASYIESLDREARRDWQNSIVWFDCEADTSAFWKRAALEQTRIAVYLSTTLFSALVTIDGAEKDASRKIAAVAEVTTRDLLAGLMSDDVANNPEAQ